VTEVRHAGESCACAVQCERVRSSRGQRGVRVRVACRAHTRADRSWMCFRQRGVRSWSSEVVWRESRQLLYCGGIREEPLC
jgi:hypothetical protein